jgi:pseudaminic acid biosynthesis-associated methylase
VSEQLDIWRGPFGRAYTDRNQLAPEIVAAAFAEIADGLHLERVLEVGCNRGHNLVAWANLLGDGGEVVGIEPNEYALRLARSADPRIAVMRGDAYALPFRDGWFDLAFTAGVLIHVSPDRLPQALDEIHRVSSRFVLAIEYFAGEETAIEYRGHERLLWKRDFGACYRDRFEDLSLIRSGFLGADRGFDRSHWWLFEKRPD